MNQQQQLRQLLDAFYRGEASPQQTEEIRSIFGRMTHTPRHLIADRRLFDSLYSPAADNTTLPDNLDSLISTAISHATTARQRPRLIYYALRSAAAAAVIIIAVALGIIFTHPDNLNIDNNAVSTPGSTIVAKIADDPETSRRQITDTQTAQTTPAATVPEPSPSPSQNKSSHKKTSVTGMRVINDPAEAETYTMMALQTLSDKMKYVDKANSTINNQIKEISETLNDILQ